MTMLKLLLAGATTACVAACDSAPSSPLSPSPTSQATLHQVSGTVSEVVNGVARPLGGHKVILWIQRLNSSESIETGTDDTGRYTVHVTSGRVFAIAWHPPNQQQPCLASADVRGDTTLDVEVVPTGSAFTTMSPSGPTISAFVYETTSQGRVPVRGAFVSVDAGPNTEFYGAVTRTDEAGRFVLCRVTTPIGLIVSAIGYQEWTRVLAGGTSMTLDIELTR
jgi:hypothetical protein